jgi:hypothetical protein
MEFFANQIDESSLRDDLASLSQKYGLNKEHLFVAIKKILKAKKEETVPKIPKKGKVVKILKKEEKSEKPEKIIDPKVANKGKRWTQIDDDLLAKMISSGETFDNICQQLKRTDIGVIARIAKYCYEKFPELEVSDALKNCPALNGYLEDEFVKYYSLIKRKAQNKSDKAEKSENPEHQAE